MGHIVRQTTRSTIEMYCGEIKQVPRALQHKMSVGTPEPLNPEDSDCPGCFTNSGYEPRLA